MGMPSSYLAPSDSRYRCTRQTYPPTGKSGVMLVRASFGWNAASACSTCRLCSGRRHCC